MSFQIRHHFEESKTHPGQRWLVDEHGNRSIQTSNCSLSIFNWAGKKTFDLDICASSLFNARLELSPAEAKNLAEALMSAANDLGERHAN